VNQGTPTVRARDSGAHELVAEHCSQAGSSQRCGHRITAVCGTKRSAVRESSGSLSSIDRKPHRRCPQSKWDADRICQYLSASPLLTSFPLSHLRISPTLPNGRIFPRPVHPIIRTIRPQSTGLHSGVREREKISTKPVPPRTAIRNSKFGRK